FVGKKFSDPPLEVEPFRPQFPECLLQRISCSVGIPMLSQAGECQFIKLPCRDTIVKTVLNVIIYKLNLFGRGPGPGQRVAQAISVKGHKLSRIFLYAHRLVFTYKK